MASRVGAKTWERTVSGKWRAEDNRWRMARQSDVTVSGADGGRSVIAKPKASNSARAIEAAPRWNECSVAGTPPGS